MADVIRIKRRASGGAAGAPPALAGAEVAFNEQDQTLYYGAGNSNGQATSIFPIGGPGAFLPLQGGTMSGALTLQADPSTALQASTKQYVDSSVGALSGVYLPLAGGTLTGAVGLTVLGGNPLPPASEYGPPWPDFSEFTTTLHGEVQILEGDLYVDGIIYSDVGVTVEDQVNCGLCHVKNTDYGSGLIIDGTFTGDPNRGAEIALVNHNAASGGTKLLRVDATGQFLILNTAFTPILTLTDAGALTLTGDPTANLQAATKQYVDAKASLVSPALTGIPTAPTAAPDTSSTQIATTAFVIAQGSSTLPLMDGIATIGLNTRFALGDHIHPSDTSRLALTGGIMTGMLTLAADPAMDLHAATKQYVDAHVGAIVSDTPPSSPNSGTLWWDSIGAELYIYYDDGNSSQWVPANNYSSGSAVVQTSGTFTSHLAVTPSPLIVSEAPASDGIAAAIPSRAVTVDDATTGVVGEVISATITNDVALTTAVGVNVGSISLTAGEWDVDGMVQFTPSNKPSVLGCAINTTSATMPVAGNTAMPMQRLSISFTSGAEQILNTGVARISVSAPTTVYLIGTATFSTGTVQAQGYISARRRR